MIATMIRAAKLGLLVVAVLGLSNVALAQRGFAHAPVAVAPARVATLHSVSVTRTSVRQPIIVRLPVSPALRRVVKTMGATSTLSQPVPTDSPFSLTRDDEFAGSQTTLGELLNPVPGLGFDYSNLAALNHDLAVRALIDPITQQELALSERLLQLTPITPISFPFFGESQPITMLEQQPPQVIVVQQPLPQAREATAEASSSTEPAAPEQPPLSDVGDFVLALHDGTQIHAVAFTRQSDRIVYITPDGLRRSFAMEDLDNAATRRLNDERGTPLQISF